MGKTKTVILGGLPEEKISGKEKYEKRKEAKEEKARKARIEGLGLKGGERIKVVGVELPAEAAEKVTESEKPLRKGAQKIKKAKVRGKKYKLALSKIERDKLYPLTDAIKLVKETSYSKFEGTVELHIVTKKSGISANVTLPYPGGKQKRIEIADDATIEKLKAKKIDFDILLATPDMMPKLLPFAKFLGPKGLMPNPKTGTLIKDKKEAQKFLGNTLSLKTEREQPIIHTVVGKLNQKDEELTQNALAIINTVDKKQILKVYLKSTMSPSVKVDFAS